MKRGLREWLLLGGTFLLVLAILAAFGFTGPGVHKLRATYLATVLFTIAIYALLALGLSVEMGYAGLLNFGHVAFMGIGAYGLAVFVHKNAAAMKPALTGSQPWGLALVALMALALGFLVYVLALLLAQRVKPLARLAAWIAAGLGALAALGAAYAMFPLGDVGAANALVFLGVLVGVVGAALAGLLMGFAGLRLREDYLAIATLGFAQVVFLVALNEEPLTGGSLGIQAIHNPVIDAVRSSPWLQALAERIDSASPIPLANALGNALFSLLLVAVCFALLETLARSPWGRVLKAIREDEEVAASLGKNVLLYKLQALMIGSALAAAAGILFIWNAGAVVPEDFLALVTFYTFAILVLGGVGNHKGALIGALVIWGIFELASNVSSLDFFKQHGIQFAGPPQSMFVGLVLILVVMLRPQGVVGKKEEMSLGK
ncbi:MAG: neutral amino acid transport system permease protein [Thermoplasmata archaeon]|jgi:branched-chain amino acid transport system permease protein|nr:neutral amino acid transport system permease protein [Thermoplasmata archaeon]